MAVNQGLSGLSPRYVGPFNILKEINPVRKFLDNEILWHELLWHAVLSPAHQRELSPKL